MPITAGALPRLGTEIAGRPVGVNELQEVA